MHEVVLGSMKDGVLALDGDGRILTVNDAGARILGIDGDEAVGRGFGEALIEIEGLDEFTQAILDCVLDAESTGQRDVSIDLESGQRVLTVVTTVLRDDGTDRGEKQGVVAVFRDVTAVVRLSQSEAKLHEEVLAQYEALQYAYRQIEEREASLATARRGARIRRWLGGAAFVLLAGVLGWAVLGPSGGGGGGPPEPDDSMERPGYDVPVAGRRLVTTHSVTGQLDAARTHRVVATVGGTVETVGFTWGQRVERGRLLVGLDVARVVQEHRALVAEVIASRRALDTLERWDESARMEEARESVARARRAAADAAVRVEETAYLLGKGVIPRNEHAQAEQALADARRSVASAERSLAAAAEEGAAEAVEAARLKHENLNDRVATLEASLAGREVHAPASGIATRPAKGEGDDEEAGAEVGAEVSRGTVLLDVVDSETLAVSGQVGEHEIVTLAPGQRVTVTGDAFPGIVLEGALVHVASRSEGAGGSHGGRARFAVKAELDPIEEGTRESLRLGMSADMEVVTRDSPNALMIPIDAVRREGGQRVVTRRGGDGGALETVAIETGHTTHGEVEVLDGLAAGDVVVVGHTGGPAQ